MKAGTERDGFESGRAEVGTAWGQVALVERGGAVVFLALADDPAQAGRAITDQYPGASPGSRARDLAEEVARRIASGRGFEGIPYEVSGTGFQEAVWRELVRIPRGEVVTYGELARRTGRPGAGRAVGAACGANPIALIVPCHRVVGSGGGLGGYRWGAGRKARILRDEGAITGAMPAEGGKIAAVG